MLETLTAIDALDATHTGGMGTTCLGAGGGGDTGAAAGGLYAAGTDEQTGGADESDAGEGKGSGAALR